MNIPPIGSGAKSNEVSKMEKTESEPSLLGVGSDQKNLQKTAEKFQFENVPKALKNTAKFFMKVVTAPPALALDLGGGLLKNVGFFMRAVPMALGGAIGEQFSSKNAKKIGEAAGFVIAFPITVPAIALEFMGRAAQFAGNLHIKANIAEEFDLGVYLKLNVLQKTLTEIKGEYAKELLRKNPSLTISELNEKFAFKFRNQGLSDITFLKEEPKTPKIEPDKKEMKFAKALSKLDAHVNKTMESFMGLDNTMLATIKLGAIKTFLDKPENEYLLRKENREKLIVHLQGLGVTNKEIQLILKK